MSYKSSFTLTHVSFLLFLISVCLPVSFPRTRFLCIAFPCNAKQTEQNVDLFQTHLNCLDVRNNKRQPSTVSFILSEHC